MVEAFSTASEWDNLVALYEDQLRSGGVKPSDEVGMLVQIAMVHWRMRENPQAAEPYFDRVRRADPAHAGMLSFFRELCLAKGDKSRLVTILTDAQRAVQDPAERSALRWRGSRGSPESAENAAKAIEQYKTVLRGDPENREARESLKRLYLQTEGYNALIELYRQDLERTPATDIAARAAILREIAAIYRDRVKSDAALVTALTQLVQLDDKDIDAVRELTRVYEALGRWRDLLTFQQRLAELTTNPVEKGRGLNAPRRRLAMDRCRFSNVQNAGLRGPYEGLLESAILKTSRRSRSSASSTRSGALGRSSTPSASGLVGTAVKALAKVGASARDVAPRRRAPRSRRRCDRPSEANPDARSQRTRHSRRAREAGRAREGFRHRRRGAREARRHRAGRRHAHRGAPEARRRVRRTPQGHGGDHAHVATRPRRFAGACPRAPRPSRLVRHVRRLGRARAALRLAKGLGGSRRLPLHRRRQGDRDAPTKLDISFRAAKIFEEKLETPERATRSYERVPTVAACRTTRVRRKRALGAGFYEKAPKRSGRACLRSTRSCSPRRRTRPRRSRCCASSPA